MKYLKLKIWTKERGVIYEKDVSLRNAFDEFTRRVVSDLVVQQIVQQHDLYNVLIIPRFDNTPNLKARLSTELSDDSQSNSWLEVRYDEPCYKDRPVNYFTVEIRAPERKLSYRCDFDCTEVGRYYVSYGVAKALAGLGLLRNGDYYEPHFFLHDDDQARFDHEYIPELSKQADDLIEFIEEHPAAPQFPLGDLDCYGRVEVVGTIEPENIRILLKRKTAELLKEEGRLSLQAERGGMLIGQVYESPKGGRRIVEISDYLVSEHTVASEQALQYTFASWQARSTALKKEFPGRRVVGWYHTHLIDIPIYCGKERRLEQTKLFFSSSDVFVHKQFFPDEWYVAMVLDTHGESVFFQWLGGEIALCSGYCIFDEVTSHSRGA